MLAVMLRRRPKEPEEPAPDPGIPDDEFVQAAYRAILGRDADPTGLNHYVGFLATGMRREDVMFELARSVEHKDILQAGLPDFSSLRLAGNRALDDLTRIRPEPYHIDHDVHGREMLVFAVDGDDDFDWLEDQIRRTGYYEHDGVWTMGIDNDKRVMAELIASFHPRRALELGCASGAVLSCLAERGIDVVGVDVSELARSGAPDTVRDRIVLGDFLEVSVDGRFDAVIGLDVFEHLNPNRLGAYVERIDEVLSPGGWLIANIPAYGDDPVFGSVHGEYVDDGHQLHRKVQVDDRGYPVNGHLILATWHWWQERLEATGMHRAVAVEAALQDRYGDYWRAHYPARASVFVFRKGPDYGAEADLADEIRRRPSPLLDEFAQPPVPGRPSTDR